MNTETTVDNWVSETITALIEKYDSMGLRASGKYERELEPLVNYRDGGVNIKIMGAYHSQFMENGRPANTAPSVDAAKKLYPIILQWIKDKGLSFDKSAAFRIALKIVYKGIKVPNKYNDVGVISSVITQSRIDELIRGLGLAHVNETRSKIIKAWQTV